MANFNQNRLGFSELLRYSHLVAPDVMALKDGGLMAGFWLRGPDLESSTIMELEYMSDMMARTIMQLDTRWHIHFEFFRRESHAYPAGSFGETTTRIIDMEREAQFHEEGTHFESVQAMFVTYVPPSFEYSPIFQRVNKVILGNEHEAKEEIFAKQLERFEETLKTLADSLSLIMSIERMEYVFDIDNPFGGNDELLQAINACVNDSWYPVRIPDAPVYLDSLLAKEALNGHLLEYDDEYVTCISLANYPSGTFPGILLELQTLPLPLRWSNRFILADQREAIGHIEVKRRQWVQKIRGFISQITGIETSKVNQDAVAMVADLDNALQTAHGGEVAWGHHTSTVVLRHKDPAVLDEMARFVKKRFESCGCHARIERMNNLEAFIGSLPGHGQENVRKPLVNSLNFADLIPLSNDWVGDAYNPCPFYPPQSPSLLQAATVGSTPFALNLHSGDVGHTLILGPTGSGKSTLLATIAAQFQRYDRSQIFFFDNGRSIYPLCQSLRNSVFYDLGHKGVEISLCPLAEIDQPDVLDWAGEWLETLVELVDPGLVTPPRRILLLSALRNLAKSTSRASERTLSSYITSVQDDRLKAALGFYSLSQNGGYLLDGDHDDVTYSAFSVFEISSLMERDKIAPAVLSYLFFQIQRRLRGEPSLIVIDEAWTALKNPLFSEKIREWLKTFRKLNAAVVLATQSLQDVVKSEIRDAVLESCPTKILLANPDAKGAVASELYRDYLQLNDRQITLVARMIRKREYYIVSPSGRRLFSLGLGPVALSFVGASGMEDLQKVEKLKAKHGAEWPAHWLMERAEVVDSRLENWAKKWLEVEDQRIESEKGNAEERAEMLRYGVDPYELAAPLQST